MKHLKKELKEILDLPILYTAIAILIAHSTQNELTQLAAFAVLLLIIIYRKHDSRIPIAFALILLALSAFQLAFQTEAAANNTAILAYYLLCTGVIAQFIEYIKNPGEDEKEIMQDTPKDTGSTTSPLEDIALIIKNAKKKLTALNKKTPGNIYSAKHKYSYKPAQHDDISKKMEDIRKRMIERNRKLK